MCLVLSLLVSSSDVLLLCHVFCSVLYLCDLHVLMLCLVFSFEAAFGSVASIRLVLTFPVCVFGHALFGFFALQDINSLGL